jgi:Tfp pilus assembly protein PilF
MHLRLGRYSEAAEYLHRQLDVHRANRDGGDRPDLLTNSNEADALTNLGVIDMYQGRYAQAIERHQRALELCEQVDDHMRDWVEALTNLAAVEWRQGAYPQAAEHLHQAVARCREIGDRYCEADALINLGLVALHQDHHQQAAEFLQQGLDICRHIDHRWGQTEALIGLGEVLLALGHPDQALAQDATALEIADQAEAWHQQARAHHGLTGAHTARGDHVRADFHRRRALDLEHRMGITRAR